MVTKPERDAWTTAYRMYEEYAEKLRESDCDAASALFGKAMEKIQQQWNDSTEEGKLILLAGYELLEAVWKASHQ